MTDSVSKILSDNLIFLREQRGLSQQQIADLSVLPRTTISNIESGSANPSIKTLLKLTRALQVGIEEILSPTKSEVNLTKKNQIKKRLFSDGGVEISYLVPKGASVFDFEEMKIKPGHSKKGSPHLIGTKEFFYCSKGEMKMMISGIAYELEEGDLISFAGNQKHSYINSGSKNALGISLVVFS